MCEKNMFWASHQVFRVMVLRMNVAGDGCEVWRVAMLRKIMHSLEPFSLFELYLHSLHSLPSLLICKYWKLWVAAVQCPTMWNDGKLPSDSCLRLNFSLEICLKFETCLKCVWSLSKGLLQPLALALLDAYFQAPSNFVVTRLSPKLTANAPGNV